ncbi:MAG: M55 family metallopeptidase [Clostridia bacterium]
MKLFISVDMEGISAITDDQDVKVGGKDYEYGRKLLTQDVNAAIEGALEAGVTHIVVNDSHDSMRNVIVEELNPRAELIRGFLKPLVMMEGIDETFDAVFLIGHHGRAGTMDGVLNHTLSYSIQRFLLNGKEVGEAGLNATIAAACGVPVVLVTGDSQVAQEVERELPGVHTVAVKTGIGMHTARCLHPSVTKQMIKDAAKKAIEDCRNIAPLDVEDSYVLEVEFKSTKSAQIVSYMPEVELVGTRTVRYQTNDMRKAMPVILAMLLLGSH